MALENGNRQKYKASMVYGTHAAAKYTAKYDNGAVLEAIRMIYAAKPARRGQQSTSH